MCSSHVCVCMGSQKHFLSLRMNPTWRSSLLTTCETKVAHWSDELPPKPSSRNMQTLLPEDLQCRSSGFKSLVNTRGAVESLKGNTLKMKYWSFPLYTHWISKYCWWSLKISTWWYALLISNVNKKSPGFSRSTAVSTSSHLNLSLCKWGLICLRSKTKRFFPLSLVATDKGLTTKGGGGLVYHGYT
jgi:hypothetical protein